MKEEREKQPDYFLARLANDSLEVEPYCACGNHLPEEYYCEVCKRQCLPKEFRCVDEKTLKYIEKSVLTHPRFRKFKARMTG